METQSIQKRIQILEDLKNELRVLNDMLKETLEKDPEFAKAEEEKAKLKEESTVVKNKAYEKSDIQKYLEQIKEKRDDIKEGQETLSLELIEYYKENSVLTIEDGEGHVRELKISVKLSGPK